MQQTYAALGMQETPYRIFEQLRPGTALFVATRDFLNAGHLAASTRKDWNFGFFTPVELSQSCLPTPRLATRSCAETLRRRPAGRPAGERAVAIGGNRTDRWIRCCRVVEASS